MSFAAYPLSGPRVPPASGKATHLVVLCHGYGADGNDLIALAPHWQKLMPGAAFVAPNGPERCAAGPGYQWFPISRLDPHELAHGVASAAPILNGFIESELAHHGLDGRPAGAGRLQPGHHAVAGRRPDARRQAGRDRRLFGLLAGAPPP